MPSIGPVSANPSAPFLSGSAFPTTPAANDVFFRTDRGLLYFWDGAHWLTVHLYVQALSGVDALQPFGVNTIAFRSMPAMAPTYDAWIVDVRCYTYVSPSNDGSNYWYFGIGSLSGAALFYTNNDTVSTWTSHIVAQGVLLGVGKVNFDASVTKVGAPGALYISGEFTYRLVG